MFCVELALNEPVPQIPTAASLNCPLALVNCEVPEIRLGPMSPKNGWGSLQAPLMHWFVIVSWGSIELLLIGVVPD